jgi:hypothetical protein
MCHPSHAHRGSCCGASGGSTHHYQHHHYPGERFGVRRPLRFLAWKLGLEEPQVVELATILNDLKTERAQADVDDRRALSLLADAAQGESFNGDKAAEATRLRTQSSERVQQKVVESLARIHALLDVEQRGRLAYLLRTGTLVM